ncbi:MAG: hypothetical protein ACRDD1_18950, partial [Planctomycetia bacterium]
RASAAAPDVGVCRGDRRDRPGDDAPAAEGVRSAPTSHGNRSSSAAARLNAGFQFRRRTTRRWRAESFVARRSHDEYRRVGRSTEYAAGRPAAGFGPLGRHKPQD